MNSKIIGAVCLCLVSVAVAQNYYEDFQSNGGPPQQQQQHRPAPARLQPGSGPVADTKPAPVAILKQINRHNEDGSYTYGFEGADGSFKIETKAQTGEVKGKYGYVDETGKVRIVEYGADKYGFQPVGEGITVAPPTLIDESRNKDIQEYDEEEQRPAQRPYIARVNNAPRSRPPPQRVQPQQYEEYQPQPQQQPQYEYRAQSAPQEPPRRQQFLQANQGPVPPRALAISGAAPGPSDVTYSPTQRPPRPEPQYNIQPRANFAPQQFEPQQHQLSRGYEQPSQVAAPVSTQHQQLQFSGQQQQPRPQIARPKALGAPQGRVSVLDQLAKDYALPANGAAALTDISFGFY